MSVYFEEPHEQDHRQVLHVHVLAAVELVFDGPHGLAVGRLAEHALGGRAPLPQQHQHVLVKRQNERRADGERSEHFLVGWRL